MEDTWLREKERVYSNNALRKTDLWQGAIKLNKWNKMNAGFAKAPFSNRTVLELVEHINTFNLVLLAEKSTESKIIQALS